MPSDITIIFLYIIIQLNSIKQNDTLSFIPNVFNKPKTRPSDLEGDLLTHSVWVEYEIYGTQI